ncbi:MAG: hypothetical protein LBI03_06670 [Clostridiales bacterium]|nr:hypothetical protein [Clostridiales bacterium]
MKYADALPTFNEANLFKAQNITFDAWDEFDRQKRIALAKKALSVSPYCTEAYNILAELDENFLERKNLYSKGVEVGKKALGKNFFIESEGCFWGIIETRPYMRAMEGLADCFWELNERQKAIEICQEMLRLNPNDNQGVRYILINWLIAEDEFEAAEQLLSDYVEISAFMLYGAVLLYFKQNRKVKAKNALKKAIEANPHVHEFLLNPKKKYIPESEIEKRIGGYSPGCASEADEYRNLAGEIWKETPGALDWLQENLFALK